jgi:periplasmic divalent cation tolerance protein
MEEMALVYTTWPDAETAEAAAKRVIEARLAACANILGPMTAMYMWDGALQREHEVPMLLKTRSSLSSLLKDALLGLHPYETPCVVVSPLLNTGSNTAFLSWIEEQTTDIADI